MSSCLNSFLSLIWGNLSQLSPFSSSLCSLDNKFVSEASYCWTRPPWGHSIQTWQWRSLKKWHKWDLKPISKSWKRNHVQTLRTTKIHWSRQTLHIFQLFCTKSETHRRFSQLFNISWSHSFFFFFLNFDKNSYTLPQLMELNID